MDLAPVTLGERRTRVDMPNSTTLPARKFAFKRLPANVVKEALHGHYPREKRTRSIEDQRA